jgi:hypothetical protein
MLNRYLIPSGHDLQGIVVLFSKGAIIWMAVL